MGCLRDTYARAMQGDDPGVDHGGERNEAKERTGRC
jgi:hypothetical protein